MSKSTKLAREKSVVEGHSPVNRYELLCVEHMARGKKGPDEEKMLVAFEAFDALIPNLGVYTRIFKRLRDDLYDAVYSDDLTTTQDNLMTKIPYFIHITRRHSLQSVKMDEMEDQLETVKKRLFEKHKQLEENQNLSDDLKEQNNELNDVIDDMKSALADKMSAIEKLEKDLAKERSDRDKERELFNAEINDLHRDIDDKKEEIEYLNKYKKGYDDLYYAFLDQPDQQDTPIDRKKPVVSTKRANLTTNIQLAKKLEDQIMTVLNTAVEEFDKFMEDHKDELQNIEIKEDITDAEFEAQEIDIDNADQQLEAVQERFKNTIGDISNELLLLKQHSTMLMEQLQIIEENHPTIMRKGEKLKVDAGISKSGEIMLSPQAQKRVKRIQEESIKIQEVFVQSPYLGINDDNWKELLDSILSAGLDGDEDDDESDPFIPQERVFSKYAAMMYTSNNQGKSFEEFKDAKFCQSCGEKTVVCPHKLPGSERVFQLPFNCTHLKISRPKVKINKEMMRELMKTQNEEEVVFDLPGGLGNKIDFSREHSLRAQSGSLMSPDSTATSMTGSESHLRHSLLSLYDDYKLRTNLERNIPRPISMERCLSIMEQFWTYVIWEDDNGKEEEIHNSIIDKLYRYMEERYLVKDIMYLCNHDFISGVVEYSDHNRLIQMYGHILVGNLEGASFRYVMLLSDFITAIEWKEVEDFRAFAAVVYPFLGEDDLETLQMSYTSYSENKISQSLVANFIIHLILKFREPRFQDMENRLMPFQSPDSKQPVMSEKEFKEAIDNILPLTNDKLRRRLYFEAEKMTRKEGTGNSVPVMILSQIASYLGLLQITNIVRDTINKKIKDWRERPSSSGSARVPQDHESQVVHDEEHQLITMSDVKLLSTNISRRIKLRQERYDMGEDGSNW